MTITVPLVLGILTPPGQIDQKFQHQNSMTKVSFVSFIHRLLTNKLHYFSPVVFFFLALKPVQCVDKQFIY